MQYSELRAFKPKEIEDICEDDQFFLSSLTSQQELGKYETRITSISN